MAVAIAIVAALAGNHLAAAHAGAEPLRQDPQHRVAGLVAEAVVDQLEVVEIDEGDRHLRAAVPGRGQRLLQAFVQQQPVGQAGQRVMGAVRSMLASASRWRCISMLIPTKPMK
jgi:hypothetical protein